MAQLKAGTTIGGKLAETVEGAQAKVDATLNSAKAYTDQRVDNKADSVATVNNKKAGYAVYAP